ncbi:hypothetical protein R4J09_03030 [Brachyspira intermedia]|uniref:hypothetical protein n=1 Tax=Brachyspira intermedia TaxID=84377 RepID=UPI0030053174
MKIDDKESALETYNKAIEVCLKKIKSFENKKISIADDDYKNKIRLLYERFIIFSIFLSKNFKTR